MKNTDGKATKGKASKVIKPKAFNQPGRKLPKKPAEQPLYCNPDLIDPGIDPNEPISLEEMQEIADNADVKTLSPQEEKLIQLFMQFPLLPKHQLATMAGFKAKSKKALCVIFAQVMVKLDSARDHKQLFREIGFGEVQLILRMKQLAMQNFNLTVASNMVTQASRCLDLQKGEVEGPEGFTITVTRAAQPGEKVETGPARANAPSSKKGVITR